MQDELLESFYNTRKRKSDEKWERPGNTYHVNNICWTRGGGGGGHCPCTNLCAINDRASFLPVRSNTVNLLMSGVLAIVQALDDEVWYVI